MFYNFYLFSGHPHSYKSDDVDEKENNFSTIVPIISLNYYRVD